VYDKYATMFVQWAQVDSPTAPLRPLIVQFVDAYAERMAERLAASGVEGVDPEAAAMVLLAVVNRTNYYRHTSTVRGLSDEEVLDTLATVVQLVLFPSTPAEVIVSHGPVGPARLRRTPVVVEPSRSVAVGAGLERFEGMSERVQTTVGQLLEAGARVFAAHSFYATSVDDVVTEAGLGRGTFYKYFGNKLDLLVALSEECAGQLQTMTSAFIELPAGRAGPAALRAWLVEFVRFHRRYAGVFRVWTEQEPRAAVLQEMGRGAADGVLEAFDDVLGRVRRPYGFCLPAGSLILLALLERLPDQVLGTRHDADPAELAELLATTIERGFLNGKRPPARPSRRPARTAKR
jgi:AcrR family transcriptional regulator